MGNRENSCRFSNCIILNEQTYRLSETEDSERGSMLGITLGLVTGLSSPKKSRVVNISENSIYVLSLEASVNIPARE